MAGDTCSDKRTNSVDRLHYIQHVPYETPGSILDWAGENKIKVTATKTYENQDFPDVNDFDFLVVMGGPMGVYDEKEFPWLKTEKLFIEKTIKAGKGVLGICLGAQLLACILGSKVTKNRYKEIGWYPVQISSIRKKVKLGFLPDEFTVFHWHGDTFELPNNAIRIAKSAGCDNQAFLYENNKMGLQFHLEITHKTLFEMVKNGRDELLPGRYIQGETEILKNNIHLSPNNKYMSEILRMLTGSARYT
jgi:GMP synthase-like glutamine amidotransferase